jgi:chemotaxis protein MotB
MKRIYSRNPSHIHQEDSGYWISISDLMSGILIVFILCVSLFMILFYREQQKITEERKKWQQIDELRIELLETIQESLKKLGVTHVIVDPSHGILRFPEGILFESGKADITEDGKEIIHTLGAVLRDVLVREKYTNRVETIFIEGHTDSYSINTQEFPSNWELSTKRAINAWRELASSADTLNTMRNGTLFSCSGYADRRPIESNETAESRKKNRRIDLRFAIAPPDTLYKSLAQSAAKDAFEGMSK